ncbi:protein Niban 1a [Clarias gariepinus]|uniref:protein Niban 1a n=1 Tax=Clarias gariepinus TaxID=13013 RepID=UPI00234C0C11|nr:protein Niban 1a [Clarias gariepinus]
MGASPSVLEENKHKFIKEWVQTELTNFAPIYKKQYSLAFLSHIHDELVQRKQEHTQLLKQRDAPEEAVVVYQESVLCFYDNKKWKERFVVVRASYSLECHESYETFMKGMPSLYKLPTTGGTILTTEEKYMEVVDRCFPDSDNVKEDFAPPMVGMPGQFPVYLRLPYQRDHYFCLLQEAKHAKFISVLSDCIRHQNQDFLKKEMYEVKAFTKAIQLYRQDKGLYEPWDMMIGNDVQVLANLTMEELLPCLEKDMFPRLKAKKTERKRMWFATIEAAYNLVQETLTEGMVALNNECLETTEQQSTLMRSDMDQIMSSRAFLENKLRATVAELATEYCKQHIAPRLPAVLEEIMGPISLGFEEARQISEHMMENLCRKYQEGMTEEELQQALGEMSKPDLKSCYEKVSCLRDQIKEFNYPNCRGLEHSTQIDIQQLVDNVAYTFGMLLNSSSQDNINLVDAMVKAKHRVLKQYDYDSSTQRKKIFQKALLSITLPSVRAFLAPTFQKDLPDFQQYIFDDYVNFINVESVYEDILEQILQEDINKVVKEAASMKKYNLFMESRYRMSLSTPPESPDTTNSLKKVSDPLPSSSLLSHGLKKAGEDRVEAEKIVQQELITAKQDESQAHAQPEIVKVPAGEDRIKAEKIVEQVVMKAKQEDDQAHAQPEVVKVSAGENQIEAERMVQQEVMTAKQEDPRVHVQPEIVKVSAGENQIEAERMVQQEVMTAKQEDPRVHVQPEIVKVSAGENQIEAEKMVKQELMTAKQEDDQVHAQPEIVKHKVEENEVPVNAATEIKARAETSGTFTVVEEMLVATQSLEKKTYASPPDVVAITTETLVDPFILSNTELAKTIPKLMEIQASEIPVQAGPPVGDRGSMDQKPQMEDLTFVSAESETKSAAQQTAPEVPCSSSVQPLDEEQSNNASGDTKVRVYDLTSVGAPAYEDRTQDGNGMQDFSDNSSWTTEEEGDSIDDDDVTMDSTKAITTPEDTLILKRETKISDVNMNVTNNSTEPRSDAARPLDCIKEIRELVVEVIEVEEEIQHCPKH